MPGAFQVSLTVVWPGPQLGALVGWHLASMALFLDSCSMEQAIPVKIHPMMDV